MRSPQLLQSASDPGKQLVSCTNYLVSWARAHELRHHRTGNPRGAAGRTSGRQPAATSGRSDHGHRRPGRGRGPVAVLGVPPRRLLRQQDDSGFAPATLSAALATIDREGPLTLGDLAAQRAGVAAHRHQGRRQARGAGARRTHAGRRTTGASAGCGRDRGGRRQLEASRTRRTAWLAEPAARPRRRGARRGSPARSTSSSSSPSRPTADAMSSTLARLLQRDVPLAPVPQLPPVLRRPGRSRRSATG